MKNNSNRQTQNTNEATADNKPVYSSNDEQNYQGALREARTQLEVHGELQPCAFIATPTGIARFPLDFETQEEKLSVYNAVHEVARRVNARKVMLVSDTWVGSHDFHGRPSEDPNRREALLVFVVNPQGQVEKATALPYTRVGGKVVWGTEEVFGQQTSQQLLKPWAVPAKPISEPVLKNKTETAATAHTASEQLVWNDFQHYPVTRHRVQQLLKQGKNVVVVLGDGVVALHDFSDTTNPKQAAMALQTQLVHQTGVPLPIGDDGLPRFAFLVWKASDIIDAPSEISIVSVVPSGSAVEKKLAHLAEALGIGETANEIPLEQM